MPIQQQIKINKNGDCVTFDPPDLEVSARDQIFWTNNTDEAHWPGLPDGEEIKTTFFMPNQIAPGDTSSIFAPSVADTFDYECSIHPGEKGKITVT